MAKALLIIAPDAFRDEEYAEPKEVLEHAKVEVTTASVEEGICEGRFGLQVTADIALRDADPTAFDIVAFVGGAGARIYFDDPVAHRIAREAFEAGRTVGAICIAPSILGHAGLLQGLRVTSFESQEGDLVASGAVWTGHAVEVDGRIVTANGPQSATLFGETLVGELDRER